MRYFNQTMVTNQPEIPLVYGWVLPDVQETEVRSSSPRVPVVGLHSENFVITRLPLEGSGPGVMEISVEPSAWEFSRAAYIFFYFGCAFLASSFGLMIVGPFIFPEGWTGLVVGVVVVVTGITFRFCLMYAFRDAAKRRQRVFPTRP